MIPWVDAWHMISLDGAVDGFTVAQEALEVLPEADVVLIGARCALAAVRGDTAMGLWARAAAARYGRVAIVDASGL
nr:hypothetical protein [bacterium]